MKVSNDTNNFSCIYLDLGLEAEQAAGKEARSEPRLKTHSLTRDIRQTHRGQGTST